MPDVSFNSLLIISAVAVAAPMLIGFVPALRIPAVVLEIVAGIVLGPSVLGWVEVDLPVQILALVGLAFLLFLAGLEIDLAGLRGRVLRLAALGFGATLVLGVAVGLGFRTLDYVRSPLLIAVALSATSLGLIIPVLKDAGELERPLGRLAVAGATIADFSAIVLLSLLFSESEGGVGSTLVLLGLFALFVVVVALALSRLSRSIRLEAVLVRLQDTTAEIRVRLAVLLLIGFVALAGHLGLETILGAFLAGAIMNLVDRDSASHPHFRLKLEAIGFGFVVPVFFIASGVRFDLESLLESPSAWLKIPLFVLALLVVRAVPAALYARDVGRRGAVAAGLLQATTLPFLVTATDIGISLGEIRPDTAAALVTAGLVSVVVFPLVALGVLGAESGQKRRVPAPRTAGM